MDDMPKLFEVNLPDKEEDKASKFISKLQKDGFVGKNKVYLSNYINADIGIAFSHIKDSYKRYVCEGNWSEEKFEDIIYVIANDRKMLIPNVFLRYGTMYDNGELGQRINLIKKKNKESLSSSSNTSKEEQELLDYIEKHGGR